MTMANFVEYLGGQAERQDPVGELARYWRDHGKPSLRSVSGVRQHLTENPPPYDLTESLAKAVGEYTASKGSPTMEANKALAEAMAAQTALSQAQMDTRSAQDYRDWAGGDQTRSEAAALGLVTPAPRTSEVRSSVANPPVDNEVPAQPGRSSVPGYEHVLPPGTKPGPAGYEGVPAQPMDLTTYDAAILPAPPDYPEVDNSQDQLKSTSDDHGRLAHAMGLDADPALAAQREAIRAEAARIQRESPASSRETPPGAFYDESADVQEIAPQSYSAEQWRAWAMTS